MAPEPCQEAEKAEKQAALSLADQEPVSGHLEPPAGTPKDPVAPACLKDTKPSSTPVVFPVNLQLAPESLDPRTLRLLWGQRELEIQALRWTIQNRRNARHCHILYEVAGLPPESCSHSQEKLLQNQIQKLTLELKGQKEQAQLVRGRWDQDLQEKSQLETELQAFQRSCLLQLARSSWVGRVLRSSTGSVEVVTAETLMDSSDLSENDQVPSTGEVSKGFRLEDVDWNSIAHRYPNLLANIKSNSDQKHPRALPSPPAPVPGQWGSELHRERVEQHLKSVEWCSLPSVGTSSSGGTDSDPGSGWLAEPHRVQKVTGQPPSQGWVSQQDRGGGVPQPLCGASTLPAHPPSPINSSLKIVAVSRKERFVRVLNQSLEETADLGGLTLRQLLYGFPVCMYRFPPGTLLAPRHHVTVWGEGPGGTKKRPPSSLGQEPVHFHSGRGCVTLLLNPKGEVLSEHRAPHCVTPVSRIFADNTDLSVDRFPLSEDGLGADPGEQSRGPQHSRAGRVREAGARRRRPGWAPRVPGSPLTALPAGGLQTSRPSCPTRTRGLLPRLSTSKLFRPREVPARPEAAETRTPELLPALPEAGLCLEHCGARKEHRVRVCRRIVDRGCPMVALSVQSTAESRYGFRFLPCPPVTADPGARV
uniref:Lamin tail domain containing 2 n=1 Tax=Panthera leo TaxID=9689 RepID=A0A8C9DB74_PANLE